jgi:hypothetical protein
VADNFPAECGVTFENFFGVSVRHQRKKFSPNLVDNDSNKFKGLSEIMPMGILFACVCVCGGCSVNVTTVQTIAMFCGGNVGAPATPARCVQDDSCRADMVHFTSHACITFDTSLFPTRLTEHYRALSSLPLLDHLCRIPPNRIVRFHLVAPSCVTNHRLRFSNRATTCVSPHQSASQITSRLRESRHHFLSLSLSLSCCTKPRHTHQAARHKCFILPNHIVTFLSAR